MVDEDEGVSGSTEVSIGELIERRLSRRGALFGLAGTAAAAAFGGGTAQAQKAGPSSFTFTEVPHVNDPTHHVPDDYEVQVLIRWGDPVLPGAPPTIRPSRAAPPRPCSSATTTTSSACIRCPSAARRATAS